MRGSFVSSMLWHQHNITAALISLSSRLAPGLSSLPGMSTPDLTSGMVQVLISMTGVAVSGQRAPADLSEQPVV